MSLLTLQTSNAGEIRWPQLADVSLDALAVAERRSGIGGSDANVIFSNDGERIRELWLEKRGKRLRRTSVMCSPSCSAAGRKSSTGSGSRS